MSFAAFEDVGNLGEIESSVVKEMLEEGHVELKLVLATAVVCKCDES